MEELEIYCKENNLKLTQVDVRNQTSGILEHHGIVEVRNGKPIRWVYSHNNHDLVAKEILSKLK